MFTEFTLAKLDDTFEDFDIQGKQSQDVEHVLCETESTQTFTPSTAFAQIQEVLEPIEQYLIAAHIDGLDSFNHWARSMFEWSKKREFVIKQ
ncbi:19032_t:CDS:2 [Dentiscutata erythropus]|uniref:19032_t:CDS:1 n=1 Tax=Dentiscutata erythropus TaxID=1348616 RepID=A0A9N9FJP8_9GLOM|nr:19032_t:CDS:2 [Dentiscutata erythropus]